MSVWKDASVCPSARDSAREHAHVRMFICGCVVIHVGRDAMWYSAMWYAVQSDVVQCGAVRCDHCISYD